jgi:hypothetical protein
MGQVCSSSHHPKQSVIAHGQHQPLGKARGRPTTKRQAEMMNDTIEPRGSSRPRCHDVVSEALGKDLPTAHPAFGARVFARKHSDDVITSFCIRRSSNACSIAMLAKPMPCELAPCNG